MNIEHIGMNVEDPAALASEMLRVTMPSGSVVILEFTRPRTRLVRALAGLYLGVLAPLASRLLSSDPDAYKHLYRTIRDTPSGEELLEAIQARIDCQVKHWRLFPGVVTVYELTRPG